MKIKFGPADLAADPTIKPDSDLCCHYWDEIYLDGWGWVPVDPQTPGTPIGRVPRYYDWNNIVFLRLKPDFDYSRDRAANAVYMVNLMGCWTSKLEQGEDGKD